MMLPKLKPGQEVWIPESRMPNLPPGFEETRLGEIKDAMAQYRGPGNMHLLKYPTGWKLHVDYGDPRSPEGFLVHIFIDAPEVGVSLLMAIGAAAETYNETNSLGEAIITFLSTSVLSYIGLKLLREFILWLASVLVAS